MLPLNTVRFPVRGVIVIITCLYPKEVVVLEGVAAKLY
jgi:hypothetical protein